ELSFTGPAPPVEVGVVLPEPLGFVLPVVVVVPDGRAAVDPPQSALAASPPHLMLICCVNGSLLRKRLKPSSWPDCGAGRTPGSFTPSPVLADAEVEPTAVAASAPVAPVAPVAVAAVVVAAGEALALDWWSIFSVRGPWK